MSESYAVGDRVLVRVTEEDGRDDFKKGQVAYVLDTRVGTILVVKLDEFWIPSDEVRCRPDDVVKEEA